MGEDADDNGHVTFKTFLGFVIGCLAIIVTITTAIMGAINRQIDALDKRIDEAREQLEEFTDLAAARGERITTLEGRVSRLEELVGDH